MKSLVSVYRGMARSRSHKSHGMETERSCNLAFAIERRGGACLSLPFPRNVTCGNKARFIGVSM